MAGCGRLVGRSQACVDELNAMATRTFYSQTVPTVTLFVGGLALLAVLWLDLSRRRALMVCAAAALTIASFAIVGTPRPAVWEPLPLSLRLPATDLLTGFAA
jgi:hypothetical protein